MIPPDLIAWAQRWGVSPLAFDELRTLTAGGVPAIEPASSTSTSEARVQSLVRLDAAARGHRLWRNNVGAMKDEHGRLVRFGLANESKAENDRLKSSDLVGYAPRLITPDLLGCVIAQFKVRECKRPDWRYSGTDREVAQERFINLVLSEGGDAAFTTGQE